MIVRSILVISAALSLAACGNASAPRDEFVTKEYIVVTAPVTQPDACYLRIRPKDQPNAAPRLVRYPRGQAGSTIYQRAHALCTMSQPGDVINRGERVRVPAT